MTLIVDAEFNSLNPSRIWVVVTKDTDTEKVNVYRYDRGNFKRDVCNALRGQQLVGHKFLTFDGPHINRLLEEPTLCERARITDTLVWSRLYKAGLVGGHSVENWARVLKLPVSKVKVGDDEWNDPSKIDLYEERCVADVEIQFHIYKELKRIIQDESWATAYFVESDMDIACEEMQEHGFWFNRDKALAVLPRIEFEMKQIEDRLKAEVPMVCVPDKEPVVLKRNQDGNPSLHTRNYLGLDEDCSSGGASFVDGCEYYRIRYEHFSPASATQRVEFLNKCGWKPFEKTKTHKTVERQLQAARRDLRKGVSPATRKKLNEQLAGLEARLDRFKVYGWKVSEANLATLPDDAPPSAHLLAGWLQLEGKRSDLVEWLAAWVPHTGRIHGRTSHIGAWTQRVAHSSPNTGNIFSSFEYGDIRGSVPSFVESIKLRYNNTLRGLWGAEPGRYMVGTDASGIQLRILAHYIDDEEYINAVVNGKSEDGTDVHSLNARLLGEVCASRSNAKTFIYAFVLGAGTAEVARILQCSVGDAREAVEKFVRGIPGLSRLRGDLVPSIARQGYFVGLDGRKVVVPSKHLVLAGLLQNGEAVVMKHAQQLWRSKLKEMGVPFWQLAFVHDEWQTETTTKEYAEIIGKVQRESLTEVGKYLTPKVPLAGESRSGKDWFECH